MLPGIDVYNVVPMFPGTGVPFSPVLMTLEPAGTDVPRYLKVLMFLGTLAP